MRKSSSSLPLDFLSVRPDESVPMHRQMYTAMRDAIAEGRLRSGVRLPSTRQLADQLGISRNVVMAAFSRLTSEGYVRSRVGSGSYVAPGHQRREPVSSRESQLPISEWGRSAFSSAPRADAGLLAPGVPAFDEFPSRRWLQLVHRAWRSAGAAHSAADALLGAGRLRNAIADCIAMMRGIVCAPEEIVIAANPEQLLHAVCRTFADPGSVIVVEDPSDPVVRGVFAAQRLVSIPARIDIEGIRLPQRPVEQPRLIYANPSAHRPLGVTMSQARRTQLLDWAVRNNVLVIEDDRDLGLSDTATSLRGVDRKGQVVYCGSFEKSLAPGMRIAFAIVPKTAAEIVGGAIAVQGGAPSLVDQIALSDFISGGDYARHVRRLRSVHAERREALEQELLSQLGGAVTGHSRGSALETVAWLNPSIGDADLAFAPATRSTGAMPLSSYTTDITLPPALVLGHGAMTPSAVRAAVQSVAAGVESVRRRAHAG